jgi:asparagine synthase (glutamine-hydrolysing)
MTTATTQTGLTGLFGVRPDGLAAKRLAHAVRADGGDLVEGTDPRGGRWMIAAGPQSGAGTDRDVAHRVADPSGMRGFLFGRLFDRDRGDAAASPEQIGHWLARPRELPVHLWGRYAGAVVDRNGELTLLRDPLGLAALYHAPCEDGIALSTRTASLVDVLGTGSAVDWEFIASFIVRQHFPTERTSLAGIAQLSPGTLLRARPDAPRRLIAESLWNPVDVARQEKVPDPEEIAETLRRDTAAWIAGSPAVALDFSGGLDSSAVAWAVRRSPGPERRIFARTLYHSELAAADERHYARAMAEAVGADLHTIDTAQASPLDAALGPARRWDCVTMHTAELRMIELLTEDLGADTALLSGGGGDQVFQTRGAAPPYLAAHLRARGLIPGAREVVRESQATGASLPRLARATLTELREDSPRRLARRTAPPTGVRFPTPAWLTADEPLPLTLPDGIEHLPAAKREQVAGIAYWTGGVDRDHRPSGKPVIYPMLSQPLVEIALRTPAHLLIDHVRDRIPLRDAMDPVLPRVVSARQVKSEYAGMYQRAVNRNFSRLCELLLDGQGVRAGVVDAEPLLADLRRTALGGRPDPGWPLIGLIAAETWCRAWRNA